MFQAVALILVSVCPTWTMGQLIGDIDKDALKALVEEQTAEQAEQEEKDSEYFLQKFDFTQICKYLFR